MKQGRIKIFAPATVANVTCGFDILGFAVHEPGDEVVIETKADPGVDLVEITGDQGLLPTDPAKNTVTVAMRHMLEQIPCAQGFQVKVHKKMPLGSGLGSSAASAVAGVYGLNQLLGAPLSPEELLPFAMQGEAIACGEAHADNVAPALLGGFVLIRSYQPLDVIPLQAPPDLYASIVHPHIEIATKDARSILKNKISLTDAVTQWGNVAGLVSGLHRGDYQLIGRSMTDVVVEPVRAMLIPGFGQVKNAALDSGALGCGISGSGPSIFALSKGLSIAQAVANSMGQAFDEMGIGSEQFVSQINSKGPQILES